MPGKVEITNNGRVTTIALNGDNGNITAGGNGEDGELILLDAAGIEVARLSIVKTSKGHLVANLKFNEYMQFYNGDFKHTVMTSARLEVFDPFGKSMLTMQASPTTPTLTVGGNGRSAVIEVLNKENEVGVRLHGAAVEASVITAIGSAGKTILGGDDIRILKGGKEVANLEGERFRLGGQEGHGHMVIATSNTEGVVLGGDQPEIVVGTGGFQNTVKLNQENVYLSNHEGIVFQVLSSGVIKSGGSTTSGELSLMDQQGKERIRLTAGLQALFTRNADGAIAFQVNDRCDLSLGGSGADGDIFLKSKSGNLRLHLGAEEGQILLKNEAGDFIFNADATGRLTLQGSGTESLVSLKKQDGSTAAFVSSNGEMVLGGGGSEGDLRLKRADGKQTARVSSLGDVFLGGDGVAGDLRLYPSTGKHGSSEEWSIYLAGQDGDIYLKNADCAEEFEIEEGAEPGTVVVITEEGRLHQCQEAYDKKVAGVISGAGKYKPGIVLDKKVDSKNRKPVALVGKVYCKVDAGYGAIGVGDLLTTSPTVGHAMKAVDPFKAFGSVIGKALQPLKSGHGLIPILIALQ